MGTNRLSIIIPVYNLEDYIEQCILSIVSQSIDSESYELIVINDGSTDKSESIINELRQGYPFIKLINTKNQGVSSARNRGLDIASGDYIFFIDGDDWISVNSLSKLLDTINTHPEDIILFKTSEVYPKGKTKAITFHLPEKEKTLFVEDYICNYTILSAPWQGLFKRSLFINHNIRMPEGLFAEDDDLAIRIFAAAQTLFYVPIQVYNYHHLTNSITNRSDQIHNEKLIRDRVFIFRTLVKYTQSFSGRRKIGLERKLDFLALDIIRLLIRKSQSTEMINSTIDQLSDLKYFPLNKKSYSIKYSILRILLNKPFYIRFLTSLKKIENFF